MCFLCLSKVGWITSAQWSRCHWTKMKTWLQRRSPLLCTPTMYQDAPSPTLTCRWALWQTGKNRLHIFVSLCNDWKHSLSKHNLFYTKIESLIVSYSRLFFMPSYHILSLPLNLVALPIYSRKIRTQLRTNVQNGWLRLNRSAAKGSYRRGRVSFC